MEQKTGFLNQETLKLIACVSMLIDHIGAVLLPHMLVLRVIGRLSFPIYCFLLAEGSHYTSNPLRYAVRLGLFAVLSEIPFDLAFNGGLDWQNENVMVTMFLGFLALECINRMPWDLGKVLVVIPFALAANYLDTDYGGHGVALVAMFGLFRGYNFLCFVGAALLCWAMDSFRMPFLGMWVPIEMFALLAMIPICLYSGKKLTHSKAAQFGFYLFYPVHLTILCIIRVLLARA